MNNTTKKRQGFTLIELMVAISIVAILSTIGLLIYSDAQTIARDGKRRGDLQELQKALEQYYALNRSYPNPEGWLYSTSATNPWITGLDTTYFPSTIPKDPLNTGTPFPSSSGGTDGKYGYGYYSAARGGGIAGGTFYMLVAHMEAPNAEDKKTKCTIGTSSYGSTNSGAATWIYTDTYMLCNLSQ